ncbi:MAG: hypothetical protein AABW51_03380 [Nanoarchaeota archaeon]
MGKGGVYFIAGAVLLIFLILVLNHTNFFNKVAEITGFATSSTTTLNITLGNSAPTIPIVNAISAQNPTESTTKSITFNFTATDTDGASNINTSTATAYFQKASETTRSNTSCINLSVGVGNNINFTCTINMYYYDVNGAWTVNTTITDKNGGYATNSTPTFTYNLLTAMAMSPTAMTWQTLSSTDTDVGSNNDPIIVNNTGNANALSVNVTSYNLRGETTITDFIYAANFTVENTSQGCTGTAMVNATSTNVTSSILFKGNNSINNNNETSGQEQIYFCLKGLPPSISQQSYSSSAYGAWSVAVA